MILRVHLPLLAGLLGLAACAPPPPQAVAAPIAIKGARPARPGRHGLTMAKPAEVVRPSEREAVIEEVPDPEAKVLFEKRLAEAAIPLGATTPRATELALEDTARGQAADMKPMGDTVGATLGEGQRAMLPVTLGPGECATFIAEGGLGVIEVDLFLLLADRSAGVRVLAEDPREGPIGVVGGRGHCYQNARPTPLAAELHVTVRRGRGVVLLRGYKK